jgi:hypothetical protein
MAMGVSAAATAGALFIDAFMTTFLGLEILPYVVVAVLGLSGAGMLMVNHLQQLRQLASRGFTLASAVRAVEVLDAEDIHDDGTIAGPWWSRRPQAVISLGTLTTIAGIAVSVEAQSNLFGLVAMIVALVTPALTVRRVVRLKGRVGSWWTRVLRGRRGRWLWRVATLGMGEVRPATVAGEPTALAIGSLIHGLWAQLPEVERKLLEEVPDLADRLEARALEHGSPDAAEAITALETLRIDLLRLQAGHLSADGLTEDLAKLQDVGRYVDARGEG